MTGFTDCSTEMFHVDYIEPGQPKKSKSILLRVIQRIVQFEKGSVNILMEKMKSLARSNCLVCLLSHVRREVREEHTTEQFEPIDTYS